MDACTPMQKAFYNLLASIFVQSLLSKHIGYVGKKKCCSDNWRVHKTVVALQCRISGIWKIGERFHKLVYLCKVKDLFIHRKCEQDINTVPEHEAIYKLEIYSWHMKQNDYKNYMACLFYHLNHTDSFLYLIFSFTDLYINYILCI